MSFSLPTFNLSCDIYTGPWASRVFRLTTMGNLAWGKRTQGFFGSYPSGTFSPSTQPEVLLLPPLTDIRSAVISVQTDMVEIPSGSGRWYTVQAVDDIGKGFTNEHRAAIVTQASQYIDATDFPGLFWPVPMP